jgi:hypothetical protein
MNIFLRLTLDCEPDDAWNAITRPDVFRAVSSPLLKMTSLEPDGFPQNWLGDGPHRIKISMFGIIPMGTQTIDVRFTSRPGGVRMMIDAGETLSGPLTVTRDWDHRMAISAAGSQKTLYRDRLVVKAGLLTPFVWFGMWTFWQYRARRLMTLARTWSPKKG